MCTELFGTYYFYKTAAKLKFIVRIIQINRAKYLLESDVISARLLCVPKSHASVYVHSRTKKKNTLLTTKS